MKLFYKPSEILSLREFAVERRTVRYDVATGLRVIWEPVGLYMALDLDEAIEKAAWVCRRASVLRATELLMPESLQMLLNLYFK